MSQQKYPQPPKRAPEPAVLRSCMTEIEQRPGAEGPEYRATIATRDKHGKQTQRTTGWHKYARFLMEYTTIVNDQRDFVFDGMRPPLRVG